MFSYRFILCSCFCTTNTRPNIDDLRQMQLPGISKPFLTAALASIDAHRIPTQSLFAQDAFGQFKDCRMCNHLVTGGRTCHQRTTATCSTESMETVRRCVDIGAHFTHHMITGYARHGVLDDRKPHPMLRALENVVQQHCLAGAPGIL